MWEIKYFILFLINIFPILLSEQLADSLSSPKLPVYNWQVWASQLVPNINTSIAAERRLKYSNYTATGSAPCGIRQIRSFGQPQSRTKRVVGGTKAIFGEFPWQAFIRLPDSQCSGVLLNKYYVATTAHCVYKTSLSKITVYLGEHDTLDTVDEPLPEETVAVIQKFIHPSFKYKLSQPDRFDIALLKLSRPAPFRSNILPICLPEKDKSFDVGEMGLVAGWGKTDPSKAGRTGTHILQKIHVPIVSTEECRRWHTSKRIRIELFDEMFCAGYKSGGIDSCFGDSGGALVVQDEGRWTVAGLVSAGFGCGVNHQPGVYHNISTTVSWIRAQMKEV